MNSEGGKEALGRQGKGKLAFNYFNSVPPCAWHMDVLFPHYCTFHLSWLIEEQKGQSCEMILTANVDSI